jgi:hypothetical protein
MKITINEYNTIIKIINKFDESLQDFIPMGTRKIFSENYFQFAHALSKDSVLKSVRVTVMDIGKEMIIAEDCKLCWMHLSLLAAVVVIYE